MNNFVVGLNALAGILYLILRSKLREFFPLITHNSLKVSFGQVGNSHIK